jgi:hypothetical protein
MLNNSCKAEGEGRYYCIILVVVYMVSAIDWGT